MLAHVMLSCPATGRPVSTDLEAHPTAWATLTLAARTLHCPTCQRPHRWTKADAWLDGTAQASPARPHDAPFSTPSGMPALHT